jgi:predicted short-subunit dehydrogenase-like oxidoreductase (DUF2520 family)
MKYSRIVLFGAGNVAVHLARALSAAGYPIIQVYSRTEAAAKLLANELQAVPITDPADFDTSSDIVIFALNDSALSDIIGRIYFSGQLALHVSGSITSDVFKNKADNYGVLYPLQTFSKFRPLKFRDIPLLIEANSSRNLANLKILACDISNRVLLADSFQRRQMHLAAVFASNFVNHLYAMSSELTKKSGFSFDLLKPLILETALKAIDSDNPLIAQTGPAVRRNKEVILKHLEMLSYDPDLQNLYTFVSNSIVNLHYNEHII